MVAAFSGLILAISSANGGDVVIHDEFDVVIAGGSTAALSAAFSAADEGARVALLEPTDWIGGQFTSSGVPAVDEAWHQITDPATNRVLLDVAAIARNPANMTPFLRDALKQIGNPGKGWVSRYCFEPRLILEQAFEPREQALRDRLTVFRDTVVKRVRADRNAGVVTELHAIQREPRPGIEGDGYDRLPSRELTDWYSESPSDRFVKRGLRFVGSSSHPPVFIDATEWGELLVLADAPYLQGVEEIEEPIQGNDRCGQSITFGFVQELHASPAADTAPVASAEHLGFGSYRDRTDAWRQVWTYRRLRARRAEPSSGDLSLQNWGYDVHAGEGGNDYPFGYLFLSRKQAERQRADWKGGIDLDVMERAEERAFAWHHWFRNAAPAEFGPDRVTLATHTLGTGHGLSKLPYIRDTRRSIGINEFVIRVDDLIGDAADVTGTRFFDRVALGSYPVDVHPLNGCRYPGSLRPNHPTLPFYIPLRALTNRGYGNLLVAGKTMAQTFSGNSATRLHPIEWSSGAAAGVSAAMMAEFDWTSRELVNNNGAVRSRVSGRTPIEWVID